MLLSFQHDCKIVINNPWDQIDSSLLLTDNFILVATSLSNVFNFQLIQHIKIHKQSSNAFIISDELPLSGLVNFETLKTFVILEYDMNSYI